MGIINCPKCGSPNPEGANFCNKCGRLLRQKKEIICTNCGKSIPADSDFCPVCGVHINSKMPTQPIDQQSVNAPMTEENEEEIMPSQKESHKVRNWTLGVIIFLVVAGVALFMIYDHYNSFNTDANASADSVKVALTPDEAQRIFDETLTAQNMEGDSYSTAYAIQVNAQKGEDCIIGLRALSGPSGRSAFKIFELVDTGTNWQVVNHIDRFVDNATITVDRQDLMMSFEDVPKAVTINNNDYFYFVYMTQPVAPSTEAKAKLVFALYNIATHDIITLDMDGTIVSRNNENFIKGEFTNARTSLEAQFLQNEASKARIIYKPTPEEVALDDPGNAAQKWLMSNTDKINEIRSTMNAVKMDVTFYDKPIFEKSDIVDGLSVSNDNYMFLCAKNGAVYGFNKKARTYFVVYAPVKLDGKSKSAVTINADGTVNVTASNINFNFDPKNLEATSAE